MKSKLLVFGLLIAASGAFAQGSLAMRLDADIPFEFYVGNTVLPAGHYEIGPTSSAGALTVRSFGSKAAAMTLTQPVRFSASEGRSRLVFNKYGDTYFLSLVWCAGCDAGVQIKKSKRERELARLIGTVELATVPAGR